MFAWNIFTNFSLWKQACVNIICNQLLYCSYMSLQIEGEEALKNRCVCDTRAEKFNIISNNHGRTRKCNFSVSDCKYRFWANLVQNIKKVSLSWNMVPRLIRIRRVHWLCSLFLFWPKISKIPFLGKFGPKFKIVSLWWLWFWVEIWYLQSFAKNIGKLAQVKKKL